MSSLFGIGAGGESDFYPYKIENSLRFDDGSSPYLTQTFSTGDRDLFTISFWIKRCTLGTAQYVIGANEGLGADGGVLFNTSDQIGFSINGNVYNKYTDAKFRDVSAWYNFVIIYDSNQSTAADRIKIYANGVEQTEYFTQNSGLPTSSYDPPRFNNNKNHTIGRLSGYNQYYLDAYLADFNFVDGQALAPTNFGESKSGVWIPKDTSGLTFGTNGFRLEFEDSSDIGNDTSGQNNDWSPSNFIAADVVSDSPTNNFATMNSVDQNTFSTAFGNLRVNGSSSAAGSIGSTFFQSTGKWYVEMVAEDMGNGMSVGIKSAGEGYDWKPTDGRSVIYQSDGNKIIDGGTATSYGATYTVGDIIGLKINLDDGEIEFLKNNASQGNASTSLDTSLAFGVFFLDTSSANNARSQFNFGQDSSFHNTVTSGSANASDANGHGDFYYAVPSGYLALVAENLPEPSISPLNEEQPEDYFNTVLYTGDDSTSQAITGVGFQPDFVWLKSRTSASLSHAILDSVRGVNKSLFPDDTGPENSGVVFPSFDSDGFTVSDSGGNWTNENANNFVSWNWLAGGSAVSNSEGTISSSVSASTKAGVSIVSYTGNATAGATVGHGLGGVPEMMIVRNRDATANWFIYHHHANGPRSSDAETDYHVLESSQARADNANPWNDTAPTSTVFTIGASSWTNTAQDYIAYLFRSIPGFSKISAYQGTGTTNNAYVYTGFRPAFILGKRSNASVNWFIHDNKRDVHNYTYHRLAPDLPSAENSGEAESTYGIDFLSNGFKIRASHTSTGASDAYIFMAFAEMPFKYANAR